MKITVVGTGYVGFVAGVCFADFGNDVICLDKDEAKIEALNRGVCPIYEPGAEDLLQRNQRLNRIRFTTDERAAIRHAELICIAVGTPEDQSGDADLTSVFEVARTIGAYIEKPVVIVDKSTVPVGTAKQVEEIIRGELGKRGLDIQFEVVSNPEFLREGKAVGDFLNPDRIVVGVRTEFADKVMRQLYNGFKRSDKPIIFTTPETAEMIKYASNAFLATKITFINEIANLCESVGVDVQVVAKAMGKDGRIGPKFLHPGPGYGGSCFPKDTKALAATGVRYNTPQTVVESVIAANRRQKELAAAKIVNRFSAGATVAVLGLSFKPETDDIRESPALDVVRSLLETGKFILRLYDPKAMDNAKRVLGENPNIVWCASATEALREADAAAILTEWSEFRSFDLEILKTTLRQPVLFDFRNIYHKEEAETVGLEYHGTGIG